MNSDTAIIAQLRELAHTFPPEPFRDRPRRPNGYRKTPEYRQWQQDTAAHENRIHQWHRRHIQIVQTEPHRLEIQVAGQSLPAYSARRNSDGTIYITPRMPPGMYPEREPVQTLPTRPLELPGPGQSLEKFLQHNHSRQSDARRWDLDRAVHRRFDGQRQYFQLHLNLPATRELLAELNQEYVERLRQGLDYRQLTRLTRLAGGSWSRPWTLLDYHLMLVSGEVLETAAASSPGAVACWLYWWLESRPEDKGYCMDLPRHPGMIIREVRDRCRQTHPQAWKVLAAMPAAQVRQMLRRQRNSRNGLSSQAPDNWPLLLWSAERIHAAQAARSSMKATQAPPPSSAGQLTLPGPRPAAVPPETANAAAAAAPTAAITRFLPDPELTLRLLKLRYAPATTEPHRELRDPGDPYGLRPPPTPEALAAAELRSQALDHFTELALTHYADLSLTQEYPEPADRRRFQAGLNDLVDYCRAEPAAVLRKRSFGSLGKASHRWHQDKVLRQIAADLERMEAEAAADYANAAARGIALPPWDQPWPCPLTQYQAEGWTARLLSTPQELFKESVIMRHCVGSGGYRDACASGRIRIYHLQPDCPEGEPAPKLDPDLAARRWGSTLELENRYADNPARPPHWEPAEHRAAMNALPVAAAEKFAEAVAAALNQAAAAARKAH